MAALVAMFVVILDLRNSMPPRVPARGPSFPYFVNDPACSAFTMSTVALLLFSV